MGVLRQITPVDELAAAAPARPRLWDLTSRLDLLVLMLAADAVFVLLAVVHAVGLLSDPLFSLGRDRGYSELFQYIKLFWITLCFIYLTWRVRQPVFVVLAVLFLYLLLDDAMSLHENGGAMIADHLNLEPGLRLRAKDFGEMIVSGGAGMVLLVVGSVAYRFSDILARRVARLTLLGVLLLAFFGIGVDMLGMMVDVRGVNFALKVIEDGGEMVTVSLIAAGTLAVVQWYREVSPTIAPPAR